MTERYRKALAFATEKHNGQFRKGGAPYVTHPIAVAEWLLEKGYDEDFQIAGLFHDLLEDTDATEDEILSLGGESVLEAVKLLTKSPGYNMADYVDGVKSNPISKAVKAGDRLHNLRCAFVCSEDFKRRYILESLDWYLDLDKDVITAVKDLAKSMQTPIANLSFSYEVVDEKTEFASGKKE